MSLMYYADLLAIAPNGTIKRLTPTGGRLVYLACPYSHADGGVRHMRYTYATRVAAKLIKDGWWVFSPLTHSHPIVDGVLGGGLMEFERWRDYDFAMLSRCDRLMVLRLKGWQESVGVQAEIAKAQELGMPVDYMDWFVDCGHGAERTQV